MSRYKYLFGLFTVSMSLTTIIVGYFVMASLNFEALGILLSALALLGVYEAARIIKL